MSATTSPKLTVLVACFHPARARNLDPMVRHALRCRFVERVIVSSHNPDLRPEDWVEARDPRVVLRVEQERRGCGHRWTVAAGIDPEYLLVVDDDVLLRPRQMAKLFEHLVEHPGWPHGLSGLLQRGPGRFEFCDRRDCAVDYLCEAYAVSRAHVRRYSQMMDQARVAARFAPLVESSHDFAVISSAGTGRPRIHDLGRLLRCETFKMPGVAVHQASTFFGDLTVLSGALRDNAAGEGATQPSAVDGPS